MANQSGMNLTQVKDYLEYLMTHGLTVGGHDSDVEGEVYFEPPDVAYDSGSDVEIPSESEGVHNLHFDQLSQAFAVHNSREIKREDGVDSSSDEEATSVGPTVNEATSSTQTFDAWKYVGPKIEMPDDVPDIVENCTWTDQQTLKASKEIFPEANYTDCAVTAYELFERFFDEELLQLIANSSNLYGIFLEQANPNITSDEMRVFIGIMIISGYNTVDPTEYFWPTGSEIHNEMILKAMSQNRFNQIRRFLRFSDQRNINRNDKMWKLRPLLVRLNKNFLTNFKPEQDLSFDDTMILYYGKEFKRHFMQFGYKVWCLNTSSGYLVSVTINQRKDPYINPGWEKTYGKSVAPLLQVIHEFPDHIRTLPFCFYFDNVFTRISVLNYLRSLGFHATGEIKERRIPRHCPLSRKDIMKKKPRGHIAYAEMKEQKIAIVKWKNNKCISVASTLYGRDPTSSITRRVENKDILVERPSAVEQYNIFRCGTDRMNKNITNYRIGLGKNKWWWPIFTWLVDVAIQNAWLLHKKSGVAPVSNLEFRRNIARYYCSTVAAKTRVNHMQRR